MEFNLIQPIEKPLITQPNRPSTWIEINTQALSTNLWLYKKTAPHAHFMPILKSNAYGHGIDLVAKLCDTHEAVDMIGVVNTQEAIQLRTLNIKKDILILSIFDGDKEAVITHNLQTICFDWQTACELNAIGKRHNKKIKIHIKVDTGLSRLGLLINEVIPYITKIQEQLEYIIIEGIFTHLSKAESIDSSVTHNQINQLFTIVKQLKSQNINIPLIHFSNSAATSAHQNNQATMIRTGIGIYGLWPSPENKKITLEQYKWFNLQPVLTWKTKIIQLKTIPESSYIGYEQTYKTTRSTKLAILPVGYWDGFDRKLSNNGFVIIKKQKAPILGRIAMNICMVDVTDIKDICITDEVTLLDGTTELTTELLAEKCGTINYEFVTRINPLIARIIKNN